MEVGLAVGFEIVALLRERAGDHTYVFAPVAERLTEFPAQSVAEGEATTVGIGCTVTLAVAEHPLVVPVTVYWVEVLGVAIGLNELALLSPIEGAQEYVLAPVACKVTPEHNVTLF